MRNADAPKSKDVNNSFVHYFRAVKVSLHGNLSSKTAFFKQD